MCLCCVFPPVLLYQPETPCLLVPPCSLPTKPGADNLSLVPTGTALQTVYLWRLSSLLLFGVVSRLFTPVHPPEVFCVSINICFSHSAFGFLPADPDITNPPNRTQQNESPDPATCKLSGETSPSARTGISSSAGAGGKGLRSVLLDYVQGP